MLTRVKLAIADDNTSNGKKRSPMSGTGPYNYLVLEKTQYLNIITIYQFAWQYVATPPQNQAVPDNITQMSL